MENTEQLIPVAIKESVAFRTTALAKEGYVQVDDPIRCPLCEEQFVLLLDPKDHSNSEPDSVARKEKAITFFTEIIMQDHINDHPHWQFRMTGQ